MVNKKDLTEYAHVVKVESKQPAAQRRKVKATYIDNDWKVKMDRIQIKNENDPKLNREMLILALREQFSSLSLRTDSQIEKKLGKERLEEISEDMAGIIFVATKGSQLLRNERLALTGRILRCLANYIEIQMKLPVTINTIYTHFNLIEHAVDLAFPGYIRAGMLKYAIMPPRRVA